MNSIFILIITILIGLALYYQFHQTPQIQVVRETIKKFESIKNWFEKQTSYHFYSSSLIVIYEANLAESIQQLNEEKKQTTATSSSSDALSNSVRITMADFAHVFPASNTHDDNYLYGLNRLIDHLKLLLKPDYKFKDVRNS
jgi:hypothetical protein